MDFLSAIHLLAEIKKLLELKGEAIFKIKAFEKAITSIDGRLDLRELAEKKALISLPGIGKSIAEILSEFILTGQSSLLTELRSSFPEGFLELTQISGVGPKKAMALIDELGIHSIAELEYACHENRLLKIKGFGAKVQEKLLKEIVLRNSYLGKCLISEGLKIAQAVRASLVQSSGLSPEHIVETGELRRRCEILSQLDFLIQLSPKGGSLDDDEKRKLCEEWVSQTKTKLPIILHFSDEAHFGYELARITAASPYWEALGSPDKAPATTENEFYSNLRIEWVPPEARESKEAVSPNLGSLSSASSSLTVPTPKMDWVEEKDIQGIFHVHTTRSDGSYSLTDMVQEAIRLGYLYMGISDHSQSAFYAQGLKKETLLAQKAEIERVQEQFPQIKLFWGIESDILGDGELDYDDATLKEFDFVVASIHSRFQMDRDTMTKRILKAIQNPYTRFLGHATGRILLGRKGYDVDMEAIIQEASRCQVSIELNSHPSRLDVDWRWGNSLRDARTMVSLNPDAHDLNGLSDTRFGVMMAKKALLPRELILNSRSAQEVEKWLRR